MLPLLGAIATAGAAHHGHRVFHLLQRDRHPGTLLFDFLQGLCSHMQVLCKICQKWKDQDKGPVFQLKLTPLYVRFDIGIGKLSSFHVGTDRVRGQNRLSEICLFIAKLQSSVAVGRGYSNRNTYDVIE